MNMQNLKPVKILLIEDNLGDARLTMEAMKEDPLTNDAQIILMPDGEIAREYILKVSADENSVCPDLILLDLNLPKISGKELLKILKSNLKFKQVPVVILSSSDEVEDVNEAYREHACCYITKPVDLDQFMNIVKAIGSFWFSVVELPSKI